MQFAGGNIWKTYVLLWSITLSSYSYKERRRTWYGSYTFAYLPRSRATLLVVERSNFEVPCIEIHDTSDRCASEKTTEIKEPCARLQSKSLASVGLP